MIAKTIASIAFMASVAIATADMPLVYKPAERAVLGLVRRDDPVYSPTQTLCNGTGTTCGEACGAGFVQCAASDADFHCFNQNAGQVCCSGGKGNSCDAGYFCAADPTGEPYCCQNGLTLAACADNYGVAQNFVSLVTAAPIATSSSSSSSSSSSAVVANTTSAGNSSSTTCTSTISASATFGGSNSTSSTTRTGGSSSPTVSPISPNAAGFMAPATGAVLLAAAAFALL